MDAFPGYLEDHGVLLQSLDLKLFVVRKGEWTFHCWESAEAVSAALVREVWVKTDKRMARLACEALDELGGLGRSVELVMLRSGRPWKDRGCRKDCDGFTFASEGSYCKCGQVRMGRSEGGESLFIRETEAGNEPEIELPGPYSRSYHWYYFNN
jgi:hypothetical protein